MNIIQTIYIIMHKLLNNLEVTVEEKSR